MKQVGIFVAQTAVSWFVLMGLLFIGLFFGPSTAYDGFVTIFGTVLLGILTNLVVAVIGLPLRLIAVTRHWLERHGRTMLLVAAAGVAAVIAGLILGRPGTYHDEFGDPVAGWVALEPLYLGGWLVSAFALVHTWWPRMWRMSRAQDRELERKLARGRALRDSSEPESPASRNLTA